MKITKGIFISFLTVIGFVMSAIMFIQFCSDHFDSIDDVPVAEKPANTGYGTSGSFSIFENIIWDPYSDTIRISMGGSSASNPYLTFRNGICLNNFIWLRGWEDECICEVKLLDDWRIVLSMTIRNTKGEVVGIIKENLVLVNDNYFQYKFDDTAFEITDKNFNVILSIEYVGLNEFKVQGLLIKPNGLSLVMSDSLFSAIDEPSHSDIIKNQEKLRPIFEPGDGVERINY